MNSLKRFFQHRLWLLCPILFAAALTGCGTAKLTNTTRTATEQLLLSDAMDRAVSQVNFSMLSGKKVFINSTPIEKVTDSAYLLSIIRQHALASGCLLQEKEEEADIILELRAGTSGTDQHDSMLGISEMTIPGFGSYSSTTVPEVAMAKKIIQKATVKIGIFAYTREGRRPVWQSGNLQAESKSKSKWLFGMGPYQSGDIYEQANFDGSNVSIPLIDTENRTGEKEFISVGSQAFFRQNLEAEKQAKAEKEAKAKAEAEAKAEADAKAKTEDSAQAKNETKPSAAAAAPATAVASAAAAPLPTCPNGTLAAQPASAVGTVVETPAPAGGAGILTPPPIQP